MSELCLVKVLAWIDLHKHVECEHCPFLMRCRVEEQEHE